MAKGKRPRILREEQRVACAGWCPEGATVASRSRLRCGWRYLPVPGHRVPIWICPECGARFLRCMRYLKRRRERQND